MWQNQAPKIHGNIVKSKYFEKQCSSRASFLLIINIRATKRRCGGGSYDLLGTSFSYHVKTYATDDIIVELENNTISFTEAPDENPSEFVKVIWMKKLHSPLGHDAYVLKGIFFASFPNQSCKTSTPFDVFIIISQCRKVHTKLHHRQRYWAQKGITQTLTALQYYTLRATTGCLRNSLQQSATSCLQLEDAQRNATDQGAQCHLG